ncbi:MAG: BatA domain-containing protein [Calditrichae bacterium]|nr:BatA domain-containing protein [Calditrichia bacterium]
MFTFLNGFLLPALAAASIPIILHFLSRKKARKLPFSSIKFLKIIENQRIKRVKLYQFLLIAARTLFIVFLVMAFARPTMNSFLGSDAANAQTTAVILLDDSYSMQAFASSQTYFDISKTKLTQLLKVFDENDHVYILSNQFANPLRIRNENRDAFLKGLNVSNNTIDYERFFNICDSIFKADVSLNNELYLISDFRIPSISNPDKVNFNEFRNFKAYKVNLEEQSNFHNRSIDSVIVKNQLVEINKPVTLNVFLSNHNSESVSETNLSLFNNDERVAMNYISLDPGQEKQVELIYTPKTSGLHRLMLQIDEDDLSFDNRYYLTLFLKDEINALYVSNQFSAGTRTALDVLSSYSLFNIREIKQSEWPGVDLNSLDLVVFDDPENLNDGFVRKTNDFIQAGKSVIIVPGEKIALSGYNDFFSKLNISVRFQEKIDAKNDNFYSIENEKNANTVFSSLFRETSSTFLAPVLYSYYKQERYLDPLITLVNRDVMLTKTKNIYIFSNAFKSDWTNLEINGLFVPMLYRTFYLAAQNEVFESHSSHIGDLVSFEANNTEIDNIYNIINPDNDDFSVIPEPRSNSLFFNGGIAEQQGFYSLTSNNKIVSTLAVNHNAAELKQPFLNENDFPFLITSLDDVNFTEAIKQARIGFELWLFFLILAFLMLVSEMILIKKIEGTSFKIRI